MMLNKFGALTVRGIMLDGWYYPWRATAMFLKMMTGFCRMA